MGVEPIKPWVWIKYLCQFGYKGKKNAVFSIFVLDNRKLTHFCFLGSAPSSFYATSNIKLSTCGLRGSNSRPTACKAIALPAELNPHIQDTLNWLRMPDSNRHFHLRRIMFNLWTNLEIVNFGLQYVSLVRPLGFEPRVFCLRGRCHDRLAKDAQCATRDLNPRRLD